MDYFDHPENEDNELRGIGGWLGSFVALLLASIVATIILVLLIGSSPGAETIFTGKYSLYAIIAACIMIVDIGLEVTIIVLVYKSNIKFRLLYVILIALQFINTITLFAIADAIGINYSISVSTVIGLAIRGAFIGYLYQSRRVKNTFLQNDPEINAPRNDYI